LPEEYKQKGKSERAGGTCPIHSSHAGDFHYDVMQKIHARESEI